LFAVAAHVSHRLVAITYFDKERNGDEHREDEHAAEAIEMQRPSPSSVHKRERHEGHHKHNHADSNRGELGTLFCQTGRYEQVRRVIEDSVDPGQLLRQLHHDADDEGRPQRRRAQQLRQRECGLGLVRAFLCAHLLDVFLYLTGSAQPLQGCQHPKTRLSFQALYDYQH